MDKTAKTDFPIHELIAERWSPRAFDERAVSAETLGTLLEAARWAPSCFNEQPWSFIVATRDDAEEFDKLLGCLVEANRAWARNAPVLMLSVAARNFERNGKPNRHAVHDVGLAVGTLTLQATALGLGVHQMAGILPDHAKEVYRIPEEHEVVAGIAIGYRGDPGSLPDALRERELAARSRKPASEFTFRSMWGRSG